VVTYEFDLTPEQVAGIREVIEYYRRLGETEG
jgi:hypothetical protein